MRRLQFTAPDLAAIAQSFDDLEQGALAENERTNASTNMDDTGSRGTMGEPD